MSGSSTLNQLLVEMDGFEQNIGVIIIAATNRPDVLDPALLRPGRFDRQVVVDRPDVRGREGILRVHTKNIPLGDDVKLEILAKGTPGLAGAELANLVNEAALLAARRDAKAVAMRHFDEAKDKVMMGMERKSMIISEREKRITSYHEIGHVLVARKLPDADPVHKVTIIPRGRALGVTTYLPIDEKHTYSKGYLESMITYALGGRAAEMLVFGELTTGAGNDIERATDIAFPSGHTAIATVTLGVLAVLVSYSMGRLGTIACLCDLRDFRGGDCLFETSISGSTGYQTCLEGFFSVRWLRRPSVSPWRRSRHGESLPMGWLP